MRRAFLSILLTVTSLGCVGAVGDFAAGETVEPDEAVNPDGTIAIGDDAEMPSDKTYEALTPAPQSMQRLSDLQYRNTVQDVLGFRYEGALPVDPSGEHFDSVVGYRASTDLTSLEGYRSAALQIAEQLLQGRGKLSSLSSCAELTSRACMVDAVSEFGRLLYRRTLSTEESAALIGIFDLASDDPELGATYTLAAMLQSPNFLYVAHTGDLVGDGVIRLDGPTLASRMALFLWNAGPDQALIDAAESGKLDSSEGLRAQLERMLSHERASDLTYRFVSQQWEMGHLEAAMKDEARFPQWNADVALAAQHEIRKVAQDIQTGTSDMRALLTGTIGYANRHTAPLYGLGDGYGDDMQAFELPQGRTGTLTSIAFLASNASAESVSMVRRGLAVYRGLLCGSVSEPPAALSDTITEVMAQASTPVEEYEIRTSHESCAGCHQQFEPFGFSFQDFDAIGVGRDMNSDVEFEGQSFADIAELAPTLAESPTQAHCVTRHFYSFVTGHMPTDGESGLVEYIGDHYMNDEQAFFTLLSRALLSEGFRYARQDKGEN